MNYWKTQCSCGFYGEPSEIRTPDTLIKSQVASTHLY